MDASKRRVKLSQSLPKLANNNDHLEEYFAAFDLDGDTQNEKTVGTQICKRIVEP